MAKRFDWSLLSAWPHFLASKLGVPNEDMQTAAKHIHQAVRRVKEKLSASAATAEDHVTVHSIAELGNNGKYKYTEWYMLSPRARNTIRELALELGANGVDEWITAHRRRGAKVSEEAQRRLSGRSLDQCPLCTMPVLDPDNDLDYDEKVRIIEATAVCLDDGASVRFAKCADAHTRHAILRKR